MTIEITIILSIITLIAAAKAYKKIKQPLRTQLKPGVITVPSRLRLVQYQPISSIENHSANKIAATKKPGVITSKEIKVKSNVSSEEKFRWFDLPFLQFCCINAPEMSSYSQFSSIKDYGNENKASETVQDRFLPHFTKALEEVSIDSKTFCWGKLFVKPDAVFYDKDKNEYIVVEYKSREFLGLGSLTPLAVFQLLISSEVVKKHIFSRTNQGEKRRTMKIRSFMRLNNKVVEVRGWQAKIQHVLAMLPEVLEARGKDSISASDLARSFVLFDKVFKYKPQNQEDARYLGQINHIRIAKTAPQLQTESKKAVISGNVKTPVPTSAPCAC